MTVSPPLSSTRLMLLVKNTSRGRHSYRNHSDAAATISHFSAQRRTSRSRNRPSPKKNGTTGMQERTPPPANQEVRPSRPTTTKTPSGDELTKSTPRRDGTPGDEVSDWLQAERELLGESAAKVSPARAWHPAARRREPDASETAGKMPISVKFHATATYGIPLGGKVGVDWITRLS